MVHVFTPEFLATFNAPGKPFERAYIKLLSTQASLAELRDEIEAAIDKYPADKRPVLVARIQSFDDIECLSAIAELRTFRILHHHFHDVKVEPPLDILGGKTPDFWVQAESAFEVASVHEAAVPREKAIIECINGITTDRRIFLGDIKGMPEDDYPRISEIRSYFATLFASTPDGDLPKDFAWQNSQGIFLHGTVYKGSTPSSVVGGVIDSYGFQPNDPDYRQSVRETLLKKVKKYRALAAHRKNLFLVVHNFNKWLDPEDLDEILFGDEAFVYGGRIGRPTMIRTNAFLRIGRNASLTALLIQDHSTRDEYFYQPNPSAEVRVPCRLEKAIKAAFKTKRLQTSKRG